jgi:hypothetical protein
MITKEVILKVAANVKNNQILNILAEHFRLTENDNLLCRFIEMCLCDNNEIKSFIKTKDDFNKMKILKVIDKLLENRCITNIKNINCINCFNGDIDVTYNYYNVTYHTKQDFSDDGLCWKTKEHKYAKIHTDNVFESTITLNYYANDVLM